VRASLAPAAIFFCVCLIRHAVVRFVLGLNSGLSLLTNLQANRAVHHLSSQFSFFLVSQTCDPGHNAESSFSDVHRSLEDRLIIFQLEDNEWETC
jgi:hypothetical protein